MQPYRQQTDPDVITTNYWRHIESLSVTGDSKTINKLLRRQRIPVITSAELCDAFGKKERERRLHDYEGENIPILYEDVLLSLLSLISSSVNSFSPCICPQGPGSGSLTLLQPWSEKKVFDQSSLRQACRFVLRKKVKQTHIWTKGICQSMTPWWQSIHHDDLWERSSNETVWFFHPCCHGNHCFALFLPALHSSTQCDEK